MTGDFYVQRVRGGCLGKCGRHPVAPLTMITRGIRCPHSASHLAQLRLIRLCVALSTPLPAPLHDLGSSLCATSETRLTLTAADPSPTSLLTLALLTADPWPSLLLTLGPPYY